MLGHALSSWIRPIAYCESDRYAQAVLLSRMRTGDLPFGPIWDDVRTLRGDDLRGTIDAIIGGFPCQDLSVAGAGAGLAGERSGLVFELLRLVREARPNFIFLENVPAIIDRGHGVVLGTLADLGYDARWTRVSAGEVGAVHIRERWFLLAHSNGIRLREERRPQERRPHTVWPGPLVTYSIGEARRVAWPSEGRAQPRVARTGDGLAYRVDRARIVGNGVHRRQTREAFERLIGFK